MVELVERIVVARRRLVGHIAGEGVLRSQLLEVGCIAVEEGLHIRELEIGFRMAVVAEGMVAGRIVLKEVGHMGVAEEDMIADRIVPEEGLHIRELEIGLRNLAVGEDTAVEGIVLEEVGHTLVVVEEDIVHKEVGGNLFIVSACVCQLHLMYSRPCVGGAP